MLEADEWRPVSGYEGLYEVSRFGQVRSLDRRVRKRGGSTGLVRGRLLVGAFNTRGYPFVGLWKDGAGRTREVHRLVALAFCENPQGFQEVNHIDLNKANSAAANLEWCSREHNMRHASMHGALSPATNPNKSFKLTAQDVAEIRAGRIGGQSYVTLGRKYNVSREHARQICIDGAWR